MDLAAALTYRAVLALFPALLAVFSLLGLVGQNQRVATAIMGIIRDVAPPDTAAALRGPIEQLARAPGAGLALVIGIVGALWAASGYVGAFGRAMNRVYGVEEGRPFWKLRPMQLVVTLTVVVALAVIAIALVLSGGVADAIGNAVGLGEGVRIVWYVIQWPLILLAVMVLVAVLYHFTPNVRPSRFRWLSLGAVLAIVVMAVGSLGLALYVANFAGYDRTYGSLAGIVVFLLWLWMANLALLFGAEFDSELERARQLRAGIEAEQEIRLPARDTRLADKRAARIAADREEGRLIRAQYEGVAARDR